MIKFIMEQEETIRDNGFPTRIEMVMADGSTLTDLAREFGNFCKAMGYFVDSYTELLFDDSENPDKKQILELEKQNRKLRKKLDRLSLEAVSKPLDWSMFDKTKEKVDCDDCSCCGECDDE